MQPLHPLTVTVHESAAALGACTGRRAAEVIRAALEVRGEARVMLAAAPSQTPTLTALAREAIDFDRVTFFHMDDYLGLPPTARQGFGNWLESTFFSLIEASPEFHRMDPTLAPKAAVKAYSEALGGAPFDLTLCGLGVNAHLAFNDPPADFDDSESVRIVDLDETSRQQQVDEGHFPNLQSVPRQALTVTIPRLLYANVVLCSVIGADKRDAVRNSRALDPDPDVPGTALKLHPAAELHVDREAVADD
ncbi:MAG: 6-phosphogluconolactonase [Actinobacteria bacterium]|nr:6-phosphogluconolactonase [Actinomycetota bacterium]